MIHINPFLIFRLIINISLNVFFTSGASAILKFNYINRRVCSGFNINNNQGCNVLCIYI